MSRPRSRSTLEPQRLVYADRHLVVVDKPAGVSTVPYLDQEPITLCELTRCLLEQQARRRLPPLGVVHRIDKDTTGLVVFTRSMEAWRHLKQQFRFHTVHRRYWALAEGQVQSRCLRSRLVVNRGDGRRGSTRIPQLGRMAVTHVRVLCHMPQATLVECSLETGRTHQIRIQLAEQGHPLLGERVYRPRGSTPDPQVPRIMLHAKELGFLHPIREAPLRFDSVVPEDFRRTLERLGGQLPSIPD